MSNTKITDLTALTGATLALLDKFVVVDVSDTTMAASGTDKGMVSTELCAGLGAMGMATNRAQAVDLTIPASYSMVVSADYEIGSGNILELGSAAILEVL